MDSNQFVQFNLTVKPRLILQESLANAKVSARQRRYSGAAWWIVIQYTRCILAKFREKIWTYSSSRTSKVDDFGTNRKRICHFLLVTNSNFGPILHRFWYTATYWLKIAYFSYPSLIRRPAPYLPFRILWRG